MKPLVVVVLSVALSTGAATAAVLALAPEEQRVERTAVASDSTAELETLRGELAEQRAVIDELTQKLAMRPPQPTVARTNAEDIEAAVRRVLTSETAVLPASVVEPDMLAEEPTAMTPESIAADIAALVGAGGQFEAIEAYYARMRKAGVPASELLAAFELYAGDRPNDPEAQVMLGSAYIQRLQEAKNGPEMGQWAMKADGAFDDALALDGNHWEARFSKAISLSFWPPIFGKQGEAITQFETLLEQQRNAPAMQGQFAETYVFLGNLYQQQGDSEKATAIWQEGYDAFPEHGELANKVAPEGTY